MDFYQKAIEYYRKIHYTIKLQQFYLQNDEKSKSSLSGLIDFLFTKILIFVCSYLYFAFRTRSAALSMLLSLIITIMLSYASYLWNKRLLQARMKKKREMIASEFILDKIKRLNNEEFKWQLARLLMKMPAVGSIKSTQDILITQLNGKTTAIGFYHNPENNIVSPEVIIRFIHKIRLKGISRALFITSGTFADKCHIIAEKKKSYLKLFLLNQDDLVMLMTKTGAVIDDETIDRIIYDRIITRHRFPDKRLLNTVFKQERIKTYILYSIVFFIISIYIEIFSVYYKILAAIFLLMSVLSYMANLNRSVSINSNAAVIDELTAAKKT